MPTFRCYRGDVDSLAITEFDSFSVLDGRNRQWICHPAPAFDSTGASEFEAALAMMAVQQRAAKQGLAKSGTQILMVSCSKDELAERLTTID